jgi:hypothetical protein
MMFPVVLLGKKDLFNLINIIERTTVSKKLKKDLVTVAKGVKVRRGQEEKMRSKKGSSSAGKYKTVSPKEFAGAKGGASKYSFPINTLARARNALARAHFAPDPEGIKSAVYSKYPELKKRKKIKKKSKISEVMEEFKEGKLRSGSKEGPQVTNPDQAIAIGISESKKKKKKNRD